MSKNKRFQKNKFLKIFVIALFLANTLLSQEKNFSLKIQSTPNDLDYWWLEKNNFGVEYDDFYFQGKWELKRPKTTYALNIIVPNNTGKIYFNESFIKHNFSDKTFIKIGRYYKDFSTYINDELSSGHMIISHNAEPMPKVGLVTSQKIKKFDKISF